MNDHFYLINDAPPNEMVGPFTYEQLLACYQDTYRFTPQEHRYHAGPNIQVRLEYLKRQLATTRFASGVGGFLIGIAAAIIISAT